MAIDEHAAPFPASLNERPVENHLHRYRPLGLRRDNKMFTPSAYPQSTHIILTDPSMNPLDVVADAVTFCSPRAAGATNQSAAG
jgi:hypothetical protein